MRSDRPLKITVRTFAAPHHPHRPHRDLSPAAPAPPSRNATAVSISLEPLSAKPAAALYPPGLASSGPPHNLAPLSGVLAARTTAVGDLLFGCLRGDWWAAGMKRSTRQAADKPSMVRGQLGVRVLGAQTQAADSPRAHTVYRTAVNYRGACHHRLIRYRDFQAFASKVKVLDGTPVSVAFPPRMWTRKASLRSEVVEARRVLIDEFMRQVCAKELAPRTEERLLRLLQLGPYARHSEGGGRPSKASDATLLLGERRTLDVGRESAEASVAIMSLPVRDEDESGALRAAALQLASALPAVDVSDDEEPAVSEMQQSSGELAAESDARGSFEDSRARRSASLPQAPVLPITPIRCTPRSALRSSESLPPAHLRKMVDFADTPEADCGASSGGGGGSPFADSGVSSASSSPSPSSKYEGAVQLQRARIGQLLQSGTRLSSLPPGAETA